MPRLVVSVPPTLPIALAQLLMLISVPRTLVLVEQNATRIVLRSVVRRLPYTTSASTWLPAPRWAINYRVVRMSPIRLRCSAGLLFAKASRGTLVPWYPLTMVSYRLALSLGMVESGRPVVQ